MTLNLLTVEINKLKKEKNIAIGGFCNFFQTSKNASDEMCLDGLAVIR